MKPDPIKPMSQYGFQSTLALYLFLGGLLGYAGGVWLTTAAAALWGFTLAVVWLIRWGGNS